MEALTAIELAGTIIRFLDVASDIFKIGSQIRNKRLKEIAHNPTSVADKMETFAQRLQQKKYATCASEAEATLNHIADDCIAIAKELAGQKAELLKRIKKIETTENKPLQIGESFALAIRWKREQPRMKEISDRFDQHRQLLTSTVVMHILERVNIALEALTDVSGQMHNNQS